MKRWVYDNPTEGGYYSIGVEYDGDDKDVDWLFSSTSEAKARQIVDALNAYFHFTPGWGKPSHRTFKLTTEVVDEIKALYEKTFRGSPMLDFSDHPNGEDEQWGNHLSVDGNFGMWVEGDRIIIEAYTVQRGAGEGGDPVEEKAHPNWYSAFQDLFERLARLRVDVHFEHKAEEEYARQLEEEAAIAAEYAGRLREED